MSFLKTRVPILAVRKACLHASVQPVSEKSPRGAGSYLEIKPLEPL